MVAHTSSTYRGTADRGTDARGATPRAMRGNLAVLPKELRAVGKLDLSDGDPAQFQIHYVPGLRHVREGWHNLALVGEQLELQGAGYRLTLVPLDDSAIRNIVNSIHAAGGV